MKGWKEEGQRTKEGERVWRQRKPRGGTQGNAALRPEYVATLVTIMLRQ